MCSTRASFQMSAGRSTTPMPQVDAADDTTGRERARSVRGGSSGRPANRRAGRRGGGWRPSTQGRFSLHILSSVANLEEGMIRERVVVGIERARRRGVTLGRPRVRVDMRPVRAMLTQGYSIRQTAAAMGLSERTLRRRIAEEPRV